MIDNPFRQWLSSHCLNVMKIYRKMGFTPNGITVAALVIAVFSACLLVQGHQISALIIWWLGRFFDGTDGIYARYTGQASAFGAYLDIVCDMAAYSIMILAFSLIYPKFSILWSSILVLYVLCITSALSLGTLENEQKIKNEDNRGLRLSSGLAEGGETGIAYSLFIVFPEHLNYLLIIWLIILSITVFSRTFLALKIGNKAS